MLFIHWITPKGTLVGTEAQFQSFSLAFKIVEVHADLASRLNYLIGKTVADPGSWAALNRSLQLMVDNDLAFRSEGFLCLGVVEIEQRL